MPYTTSFGEALKDAVMVALAEREVAMAALLKWPMPGRRILSLTICCQYLWAPVLQTGISARDCGRSKRAV